MPRIDDITGAEGGFQFSGAGLDRLLEYGGEFTLAAVAVDASGSVEPYVDDINEALQVVRQALQGAATADRIVLRVAQFANGVRELHGFEPVAQAPEARIQADGMTALYDAVGDALSALRGYAKALADEEVLANGVLVVITDGYENHSETVQGLADLKERLKEARQDENLESIAIILVAVNAQEYEQELKELAQALGLEVFVALGELDEKTLRRLARVVSQSVQAQ